jgi:hypothetical protein
VAVVGVDVGAVRAADDVVEVANDDNETGAVDDVTLSVVAVVGVGVVAVAS